jgi:hypothetical protein
MYDGQSWRGVPREEATPGPAGGRRSAWSARRLALTVAVPVLAAAAAVLVLALLRPGPALSYPDLVARLTDLEALAVLPEPGESCRQWSSYDRASRYDAKAHKYVDWDANADGGGFIRRQGKSYVLAEMRGPGCIYRIWSAGPGEGHVRIYLDGAATPAVDLPFRDYFDGQHAPFTYSSLVHTTAGGHNLYVPIPFQRSCTITADKDWGQYYHITYVTFPESTAIPTFTRTLSPRDAAALEIVDGFLSSGLGRDPAGERRREKTQRVTAALPPGKSTVIARLSGKRAITALRVKLLGQVTDPAVVLRELVLKIRWDGERSPSVWAPLGDYFGTAPGPARYRSLPLGMTDSGYYSFWYMPFSRQALVEIANEGKHAARVQFSITHAPLSRPIKKLGRFHAKWHRDALLPADPGRAIDWTILRTTGRGRFVGTELHVWNPRGGWWGEGDEKFFVDGERFPSTFGTGSEDYFGYAWADSRLFSHALHNQTRCENDTSGHVSVNRWQVADSVPFQRSFEAAIEKYCPNQQPTLYDCMAYWYQAPGGADPYGPVPLRQRVGYDHYTPVGEGGLEGEELAILRVSGGHTERQHLGRWGTTWSKDAHLWWTGGKPGDVLVLSVPVTRAGEYDIQAKFTKAPDYGIVQLLWDGRALGVPIDLYASEVAPTPLLSLGRRHLTAGKHELTVKITGAKPKALPAYMFGLDYVKLRGVKRARHGGR